jgi:competence protein ComEA
MSRAINRSAAALALGAALLLVPLLGAAAESPGASSPEVQLNGVVNVNTATVEELELLPGVGAVRAQAIVEYRKEHGAFEKVEDLVGVKGIGVTALERLRPYVVLRGKTTARMLD